MLSYRRFLELEEEIARKKIEQYEKDRIERADQEASAMQQVYELKKQAASSDVQASLETLDKGYRDAYDANAVEELVLRRNAAEALANANTVNSGLNGTQQAGISLLRGNADRALTEERQEAVEKLMREMDTVEEEIAYESAKKRAAIYASAAEDMDEYRKSTERRVVSYADKRFKNQGEDDVDYKDGSVNAVKNDGPSVNALLITAKTHKRFYGEEYASLYLDRLLMQGTIDTQMWSKAMDQNALIPVGEEDYTFEERVERLMHYFDERQARLYVEYLRKCDMITQEQADKLREHIYVL